MNASYYSKAAVLFCLFLMLSLPVVDALSISSVRSTDITDKSAIIRWSTDEAADSVVTFGTNSSQLSSTQNDFGLTTDHAVPLTGLNNGSAFFFKVRSATGQAFTEDNNAGNFYVFSTPTFDTFPPRIGVLISDFSNRDRIDIVGETEFNVALRLYHQGVLLRAYQSTNGKIEFSDVSLTPQQNNTLLIEAIDNSGNTNNITFSVFVDVVAPVLSLVSEIPAVLNTTDLVVAGNVSELAFVNVTVNNQTLFGQEAIAFQEHAVLADGENSIIITAVDHAGNSARIERMVVVDTIPPDIGEVIPLDTAPFYYEGKSTDQVRGVTESGASVYMFVAAISTVGRTAEQPPLETIIKKAQFKTSAEADGRFEFDDVNFEHPGFGIGETVPEEVPPATEGLSGGQFSSDLQQDERTVPLWIAVVDKVGLSTVRPYTVSLGSCFSGFFDFTIKTLPSYQTPTLLSPQRLDSGTEIISFVLDLAYRGRASNNSRDPRAAQRDDDYWEISDVSLEPACRDNAFLDRNPSYRYACQLLRGRPGISRPINTPLNTDWYFRYNLGPTDQFTNFKTDFWKQFPNSEFKFPLRISVRYNEKLPGKPAQEKTQTLCREVSYFVDVPIDPRKVLPDDLLTGTQNVLNDTITTINTIIPTLEQIIQYVGIGCLGSFGLRLIIQIYRRFAEKWDYIQCKTLGKTADKDQKCPLTSFDQLSQCYYINDGDDAPYPSSALSTPDSWQCPNNQKQDIANHPEVTQYFSGTILAWKTETQLYRAYRWLCDRVFCHAAPAGWTQDQDIATIRQRTFEQQQCAADSSSARTLVPIDNCWEELAERQKVLDKVFVTRDDLVKYNNRCYSLGNAIYRVSDEKDASSGSVKLVRVDKARTIPVYGQPTSQPDDMWAIQVGDTYYTSDSRTCQQVCGSAGSQWQSKCDIPEQSVGWYPAGPTSDCWVGQSSFKKGEQCFCQKKEKPESESRDEFKNKFGAQYAGPENGAAGTGAGTGSSDGWPWNYREWQIDRATRGQAGIFYPTERYYSGRDKPAAFGADYLLDYFQPVHTTPEINPFTQHIGAFQGLCLTGIRGRLLLLRNILQGLHTCLQQIKTTGKADAGVCKEIFSQFVCNLVYKTFTFFEDRCVPEPFSKGIERDEPDLRTFLKLGTHAVTDTVDDSVSELQDEYGNSKLNEFLAGGSEALMKKVCLAAFGIDTGFDFKDFLDAAYSVPFVTSAMIFSSEGALGRREFLSSNPQNLNSIYEYRAAWTIFPGCDLEGYTIDLAAVTQNEARQSPNIQCSAINNYEPGSNGCDNWKGPREITHPFYGGGRVTQGVYVDMNKAMNVEDRYRYDHFKVTLYADPRWPAEKCFPRENRVGDHAVFYFPIRDATAKDLLQCDVSPGEFSFYCSLGDKDQLGQSWIDDVRCFDPRSQEWKRCENVVYSVKDRDPLRVQVNVFSSGQKMCLKAYVQPENSEPVPAYNFWWDIVGLGKPGALPIELPLIPELNEGLYVGRQSGDGVVLVQEQLPTASCTFARATLGDAKREDQKVGGQGVFTFTKIGVDNYNLRVVGGVDINKNIPQNKDYALVPGGVVKHLNNGQQNDQLSKSEIQNIVFTTNGYGITQVSGEPSLSSSPGICRFQTFTPISQIKPEQRWTLYLQLNYPDAQQQCIDGATSPVQVPPGTTFKTEQHIDIHVRRAPVDSPRVVSYTRGRELYSAAIARGSSDKRQFVEAANAFSPVFLDVTAAGDSYEIGAYWWRTVSLVHAFGLEGDATYRETLRTEIVRTIQAFERRGEGLRSNSVLYNSPFYKLVKAYLGKIALSPAIHGGISLSAEQAIPQGQACDECAGIYEEWYRVVDLLGLSREYYNSDNGVWVDMNSGAEARAVSR